MFEAFENYLVFINEILALRSKTSRVVYARFHFEQMSKVFNSVEHISGTVSREQKLLDHLNSFPHVVCWTDNNHDLVVEFRGLVK